MCYFRGRRVSIDAAVGIACFAALVLVPTVAMAHEAEGVGGGFVSGFTHPLFGWDHVVAMVAVGLWGAFLGAPAIWLLPIVFPLVMAGGAALGIANFPLPAVELGIAASAVVLGILVATAAKPSLWIAAVIVGVFAIFHGYAHGAELPAAADALAYAVGFVVGTGMLHAIGIAFGLVSEWNWGKVVVQAAGGVIAVVGMAFLVGVA